MLEEVERWLTRRSWSSADRPLDRLTDARDAEPHRTSVSVVLPALNEEATVGAIVTTIRRELMEKVRLVDELVVIDSGSTDATAAVARAAGARVVHRDAILPRIPALPGKGEVLWRSLLVTSGEIICFIDADLKDFSADFVSGTVGPLLTDPTVQFVKAMYDRPFGDSAGQGGRVTELVARPLLNLHWPQLAASCSRWAASTRYGARCWSGCRSRSVTEWSWGSWWTPCTPLAWTRWARWTSGCGATATRTGRRWAGWRRRSTARRSCGSPGAIWCGRR